ncbi:MAG: hypothetical protein HIU57_07900 [Acidobacteria bacterium]|nr:hypothetical protein [Acidobacteriota bacterium]
MSVNLLLRRGATLLLGAVLSAGSLVGLVGTPAAATGLANTGSPTWTDQQVAAALNLGNQAAVNSVSCVNATFCVAGGFYTDATSHLQALVSTWDGTSWTDHELAAALNLGNQAAVNSVSCVNATFCVAGGYYTDTTSHLQAFASTWDGTSWTDQQLAATLNQGNQAAVNSVSCVSASFCVAGGDYTNASSHFQAFASTWDGTSWTDHELAAPLDQGHGAYVDSVSCVSATFCVAGGIYSSGARTTHAFTSVWAPTTVSSSSPLPSLLSQSTLLITSATSANVGSTLTLSTSGGSGVIDPVYGVSGVGCSVLGDQLSASWADTCVVTAVNPSSADYSAAVSAPVSVHFSLLNQNVLLVNPYPADVNPRADSVVILTTSGGSGISDPVYSVSGVGCSARGDQLRAAGPDTCVVTATEAASGDYGPVTSAPVSFHFTLAAQRRLGVRAPRHALIHGSVTLHTTGGSGRGASRFHVRGAGCVLRGAHLSATRATRCVVHAHKNGEGPYRATNSRAIVVTFTARS